MTASIRRVGTKKMITERSSLGEATSTQAAVRVIRLIWLRKWLVMAAGIITAVLTFGVSMSLPRTYQAEATILPGSSNDVAGSLAMGLASQLGVPSALGGLGLNGGRSADLVEILNSRSMAMRIIDRYHLGQEIRGWKNRGELVARVRSMVSVTPPSMKSKIITIQVSARRADLAAMIGNAYVSELKTMLDEIGYNRASRNRRFVQAQLDKSKQELSNVEERLAKFQREHQITSLPDTISSAIRTMSDLEAQQISADVQYRASSEALDMVRSRIDSLQASPEGLVDIEIKRKSLAAQRAALTAAKQNFMAKLAKLPPTGMQLARLQRDVQVQNAIYLALTQQMEAAIISEDQDSDSFVVLDRAEPPYRPSSPRSLVNALAGLFAGLVLGGAWCVYQERSALSADA